MKNSLAILGLLVLLSACTPADRYTIVEQNGKYAVSGLSEIPDLSPILDKLLAEISNQGKVPKQLHWFSNKDSLKDEFTFFDAGGKEIYSQAIDWSDTYTHQSPPPESFPGGVPDLPGQGSAVPKP